MTHRRDNNGSHASFTPDTVSELHILFASTWNPLSDLAAEILSAAMLLEPSYHVRADLHEQTDDWYGMPMATRSNGLKLA